MTRLLSAAAAALLAASAAANPMLQTCLPVAPASCGLTDASKPADYIACFDKVALTQATGAERLCADELLHAKVHASCDAADIPQFCGDVKPGDNRVMTCLTENRAKLSKPCGAALRRYNEGIGKKKRRVGGGVSAVRC